MIDKYIKMRNSSQYQINWFYDYYIQNGGNPIGINQFNMVFNMVNLNEILEALDKKFNLISISDSQDKLLKVFKYE